MEEKGSQLSLVIWDSKQNIFGADLLITNFVVQLNVLLFIFKCYLKFLNMKFFWLNLSFSLIIVFEW